MSLLLDTAVFLWFISGDARLPAGLRVSLQEGTRAVYLSAISLWEIIVKAQLGKLKLPEPAAHYIPKQRERHRIEALPLDEASVTHLSKLPSQHRDPFDRMLICQALEHGLAIVTPDEAIRAYPIKTLWI